MDWVIIIGMIIGFATINEKIEQMKKQIKNEKNSDFNLKDYLGKEVSITVDNEDISNSYLFSSIFSTVGFIKDYDQEWILFEYQENKSSKKKIEQYIRISDITSINEIKKY